MQFVGIMVKYVSKISMFRNVHARPFALITLYSSDMMLKMFAFRNQIVFSHLFSHLYVVKGSQFSATVSNCLDVCVSKFNKETEQAVCISSQAASLCDSPAISTSFWRMLCQTLKLITSVN